MGKRKHYDADEEEYLERKIKRLKRQKSRIRRKRRQRSYSRSLTSSMSSRSSTRDYAEYMDEDQICADEQPLQESSQNEELPFGEDVAEDSTTDDRLATRSGLQSVVVRPAAPPQEHHAPTPPPVVAPAPLNQSADATGPSTSAELSTELEPNILNLLGDEPVNEDTFGPCIHKVVACRWTDILINGLKDETKKDISQRYEIPENFKLIQPPIMNLEIKAACNENVLKRDNILIEKQNLLAKAITGVANTVSMLLTSDSKDDEYRNQTLKCLSDTGRLLCHLHFTETQTRRTFLLPCLNKEVKDNIKDPKRDSSLFGKNLQESLKSMKATTKTGAELRPPAPKQKIAPRGKQAEPPTSRALNWRGQPPLAAPPPPRRAPAKTSSPRGGYRRPAPRRQSDRRAPPAHSRTSRR
ncbi:hypothetical protein MSG28_010701 [Choristoneura fumiferana]|uniref:Uncharacterized protein n=1 Tax=Choristoneura fumiferana TaxID=7141 RepID=A0ACC0KP83_CHOFU|nr:hypothetical protein MSG28_010701 [Choristoneura fumiferana]